MLSRDGLYNSRAFRIPQNPRDFGRAWHSGRPRVTMREPMASDFNPDAELVFPEIALELVEDVSPPGPAGFLRLVRRRLRARYPDGSISPDFPYDEVDRRAIDAVIIAAHFRRDGERWVYLRSAVRPPLSFRDPSRSPVPEAQTGALWELPAGLIEPDEQTAPGVLEAGRRELAEELGFEVAASDLRALGPATLPAPGFIAERHFFVEVEVDPARRGEPSLDGSALERFGRVVALPLGTALALCRNGRIEDAKTELGLRRLADVTARSNA
jgi:ADP-ribose diphosphatase